MVLDFIVNLLVLLLIIFLIVRLVDTENILEWKIVNFINNSYNQIKNKILSIWYMIQTMVR